MAYHQNDEGLRAELDDRYEYVETSSLNSRFITYVPTRVRIEPPTPTPVCEHENVEAVYGNEYDEFFMQNPVAHLCTVCEARLP